jgi:hypothetical protein
MLLFFLAGCRSVREVREEEKRQDARRQAQSLGKAVEAYHAATDEWPQSLKQLTVTEPKHGLKAVLRPEQLIDPWNQPYQYQPPPGAKHNGRDNGPDVWTVDPNDGTQIGNWRKK